MDNLIEINLDENLVIPIQAGCDKKEIINILAEYYGYNKGKEGIENKTFKGSLEDFNTLMNGKENGLDYRVIQVEGDLVTYQEIVNVPFDEAKTPWVISKLLVPSTQLLISILTEIKTVEIRKQLEEKQMEVEATKLTVVNDLSFLTKISGL